MTRIAFILTHPIQYFSPFFKELAKCSTIELKVFYTLGTNASQYDEGFKINVKWDIDLLNGYDYYFVKNNSKKPSTNEFNGINCPDLISDISKYNPDKIVIHGWNYKSHLEVIRFFKNKKKIYFRGDSTFLQKQNFFIKFIRITYLKYFVYRHIDYAFYVGRNNKHYFLKCGLSEKQLLYFPYSIDSSFFVDKPKNITTDKVNLLFVGKLQKNKNPLILLKAITLLKDYPLHLKIIGDGELIDEIKEFNSNQVEFCGFKNQTELVQIYKKSDILILPSLSETWGLVLNEAAASGLALIASDMVGGAIDMIQDNVNGYIFKSNDLFDLTAKIKLATENTCKLNKMKLKSIEIAENYKVQNTVNIFLKNILGND